MPGPLAPPDGCRFSTGEDVSLLVGPSSAPSGAVTVDPAVDSDLYNKTVGSAAGAVFWLAPGVHTLGNSQFGQVIPKDGNTYLGAPGAVLDGRNVNSSAFTQQASNVTIKYLEIRNFVCNKDEFVVNHDAGDNWTIQYCNIHGCTAAGVGLGSGAVVSYCWLHDNAQYGFSSYKPPVNNGGDTAIGNVLVDHCEISNNGTVADEIDPVTGDTTGNGRNGGGKFWDTTGITVTNNWVHDNHWVGIWADTNNVTCRVDNNLIEGNNAEGFFYEISYNFLVNNNTFRRNAIFKGLYFAGRGDNFPIAAIYLSEAGGDPAAAATYALASVEGNTFIDNWGDITLWENADRFFNSPANTSGQVYKPKGHGASLAVCNEPTPKPLTVSTTAGSALFTVTSGTFEATDAGRPASGAGIPAGATIDPPTNANSFVTGYISATHGRLSTPATATAGGVTLTLAAGAINTEPGYTACRWKTQNIRVENNSFSHDHASVVGSSTIPAGVSTGKVAVISQYGTFPSWSPYQGTVIETAITFDQNNAWLNNRYAGAYSWMVQDTGTVIDFPQWQASPYNQDAGSTFTITPGAGDVDPLIVAEWTISGGREAHTTSTRAHSGGSVVPVLGRRVHA